MRWSAKIASREPGADFLVRPQVLVHQDCRAMNIGFAVIAYEGM